MGPPQLWLLLLLSSGALTQNDNLEGENPACSKDTTRFKHFRKYVYNYEAETTSGVAGTADSRSGSKISCKVDLEVPQLCKFVLRTSQCSLREVTGIGPEGKALLKKSKSSDEFAAAMSQYELKFTVLDGNKVELYPEENEPVHILNLKRGIISALIVPMETEDNVRTLSMDTIYGNCESDVEIESRKGNTAAEMAIRRNLKSCDNFNPIRDYVSPVALIKGLNVPLSTLISSNQHCKYSIDPKKKHATEVVCSEKHLFLPSSYKNQYGMMAQITQTLKLEDTPKINHRDMDVSGLAKKGLALEGTEAKSLKHGDAVLKVLQELQKLSVSEQNQKRASLFYRFVTGLRGLHNRTLGPLVPKLMETSSALTIQALTQCGTPECFGAILQILRTGSVDPLVADAVTYSLGLLPSPCTKRIREILNMAQYNPSRASFYALSHAVNRFYDNNRIITEEINDVASFMTSLIGNRCQGNDELTYLTLRAIGNMGQVIEAANPEVKRSLKSCMTNNDASSAVQKAAIQALRKMTITDEDQGTLVGVFQETSYPADKRLTAYLMLMRNPSQPDISKVVRALMKDRSEQVKSFVASHIANILDSEEPGVQSLKEKVQHALKGAQVPAAKDFRRFSQNYLVSKTLSMPGLDPLSAKVEGNLLFDSSSYVPKESMLKTTLQLYGLSPVDIFEIGLEGKSFEPTLEAMFGPKGFFPDSASKALYWVDGKVSDDVSKTLSEYFGYSKDEKQDQDIMKGIMLNFKKLIEDLATRETPEATAFLRILGEEVGYLKLSDVKLLGNLILRSFKTLESIPEKIAHAISPGNERDLFVHYIFMDNEFELPTGAGLQLQVALSGVATPGAKVGMKITQKSMQVGLTAKPSVAVEFITHVGVNMPEFARNGVQMNTNLYHESGIEANLVVKAGQLKLSIPAPKAPTKLFSISNVLHLVTPTRTEVIPPLTENRQSHRSCRPFFAGLDLCTRIDYSASTSEATPYYPLTGDSRYEIEIQPTGEVTEYTASANYELENEGRDVLDTLKFIVQAEGVKDCEAALIFRYNRDRRIFTGDLQVPSFNIDVGTNFRITDESTQERKAHTFILDINNKKIPEVTLTGRMRYIDGRESMLGAVISIPRLQTQARTEAVLQRSSNGITFQIDSSATAYGSSISERIVLRYDDEKVDIQWNSGSSAALKKMAANIPVDFGDYSKALQKNVNELLDHKVDHSDMTLRHILSGFIRASNTWLQQASRDVPYAQTLQDKLSGLKNINFQSLPHITIPEELFLNSDGQFKYVWNKESTTITVPLPFGGKSSHDMGLPRILRTSGLVMQPLAFYMPPQEYSVPPFTIPKSYTLRVPLLGAFEISSNVYSNFYNWSASYSLANSTKDTYGLRTNYHIRADSVLELFSYNIQGQGEANYDQNTFTCTYVSSMQHRLLNSNFKFNKANTFGLTPSTRNTIWFETSSPLGAQFSLSAVEDAKYSNKLLTENVKLEGQLKVASAFAKTTYTLSSNFDANSLVLAGESDWTFDSNYLQATNKMTGRRTDDAWTITSVSDVQQGFLTNTASLKYENSQLKLTSETTGSHRNFAALNKLDLAIAKQGASFRSEYQATYLQNRYYTLLLGSVNSQGLQLNADVSANGARNKAAHKCSLMINRNGLASSATTNLMFSPLTLESKMNTQVGPAGTTMAINTIGHYGKNNVKFDLDGRAALTEIMIGSVCQSSLGNVDGKNVFNFRVNKDGLKFSNGLMGSYKEMKLELTHDLNLAGLSLTYTSNLDNAISADKFHKHHFDFRLQPYTLTANVNNNFKYGNADIANVARLHLEPLKVNFDGNVKGAYGADEVKHTYAFTYADLAANFKTDTVASIQGAALTHRVNLDVAGLSSSVSINTNCDSRSLRFSNVLRSVVAPFTLTVDMHTNGDGSLLVVGDHTGQLYSKFLLKAEPLAFTFSHDYRGSTIHNLNSGKKYSTLLDNKVNVLFTPSEQRSAWKLKSELNNNVYTQDLSAVNDAERIGAEISGQTLVDLSVLDFPISVPFGNLQRVNVIDMLGLREVVANPQEFSLALSVKYDKNTDMHVINLPFLENLPVYFEKIRHSLLSALKSLQKTLKSINIDQHVRKYRAALDKFPQKVNDYVNTFNLESKVNNLKEKLDAFIRDYTIGVDDLQLALENTKNNLQEALAQLQTLLIEAEKLIRENFDQYDLRAAVVQLIERIVEKIKVIDRQYQISAKTIDTIQQLKMAISQFDASNIGSSTAAWIQNMDAEYKIRARVQDKLDELKSQIESIDVKSIADNWKHQIETIDLRLLIERLQLSYPVQKLNQILERVKDILLDFMEDYEISEKINVLRGKIHELIVNYKVDQQARVLLDKLIQVSNQHKIKETVQKLTLSLKKLDIKLFYNQILKAIDDAVNRLQTFDYQNLVDEVNKFLDRIIKKLRHFDYNKFVDETNNKIQEIIQKINEEIRELELPQKAEAAKRYIRDVAVVVAQYAEKLKESRLAIILDWFKDLLSSTAISELKTKIHDYLAEVRSRIYEMDVPKECQRYLEKASQLYNTIVTYMVHQWHAASKKITHLAEQYNIKNIADNLNQFVESGFIVPEIRTGIINVPAFEVSLRALQEATFQTPDFMVPLTDLHVPSYQVNFKKLKDIRIPVRFTTPEFSILNTFLIPSYTVDFNEIKVKIVKMIDQIISSDFQLPAAAVYFKDLRMKDMPFSDFSFPEMNLPELQIPELVIPKLNLNEFQFPDIQIPEFQLPRIPHTVTVPAFGQLTGTFRAVSPFFTLSTNVGFQNTTAFAHSPEFVATVSALVTSKFDYLDFTLAADARLSAPEMKQLILKETLKLSHLYLKADHNSEITFLRTSAQGNAETTVSLRNAKNAVELHNKLTVSLQKKVSMESKSIYTHRLNVPNAYFTSQAELSNEIKTELEAGRVMFTSTGKGNWKWDALDYSDEGTHASSVSFTIGGSVAALVAENRVNDKYLKVDQRLQYECHLPSFASLQVASTVESPQLGLSVLNLYGSGDLAKMKTELTGTHNLKLNGRFSGMIKNSVAFLVQPFEIRASTENEGNVKVSFPLRLVGKIDFRNNYGLLLNPSIQLVGWTAEGRFNQYRYAHNISAANDVDSVEALVTMSGDANLDFLSIPVSIPEIHVPYTNVRTSPVVEYSLWEETGLKNFLKTTKQSFDLNLKALYKKNKDMHTFEIPFEGVQRALQHSIVVFNKHFERGRDDALAFLTDSYNRAKTKFDQYKVDTSLDSLPQAFRIPGYTIPVANIEVSPFIAELPAFGYVIPKEMSTPSFTMPLVGFSVPSYTLVLPSLELPVLHIPHGLRTLKLPSYRAHKPLNRIYIPALGNFTYDFSFKSSVITLNTNAGLFNQSDLIARLSSSSTSVIDALQYKLDGTTSLTRQRGLKLATALSVNNKFIQGNHDSTISLTRRNIEAAVTTATKINTPCLKVNFGQELKGNTRSKPILSSVINVNYVFDMPTIGTNAKGAIDNKYTLESITSDIAIETSTNGFIEGVFHKIKPFSGKLLLEANAFLNTKGIRSGAKFESSSKVDGIWNLNINDIIAVEASAHRLYVVWDDNNEYFLQYLPVIDMNGKHGGKLTSEVTPGSISTILQIYNVLPQTSVNQVISVTVNTEHQKIDWKGEGQIFPLTLGHDLQLTNTKTDIQFDLSGSLGGHIDFLKRIVLPVYDMSLWDVLKLDLTTRAGERQYLNASTALIYTKNEDGYFFPINVNRLADGFTFTIPEIELKVQNPVITIPGFNVPFTTLQVPPYTIDLREIKVPEKLSTMPFDIGFLSLPKMRFPQLDVLTSYVDSEGHKHPYFELTVPEYLLTISEYTLPKTVSFGNKIVDLNAVANKIADFDLPTITIPERRIEIPAFKLALPAGIYFPKFGALSSSVKVASPVYSFTGKLGFKNNEDSFERSIDLTANSPLQFLEYDLDALTTYTYKNGLFAEATQGTLSHLDLSAEYKSILNMQGFSIPYYTASLDIMSPTFTDAQVRYEGHHSGIYSSVSSSSAGTLGFVVDRDADIISGKLFYRTQSNPQNDIDIVKSEISFGKPDVIQVRTNWEEDGVKDLLLGLKEKVPKMVAAAYNTVNKYHRQNMGMDINTAGLKLKEKLRTSVDGAFRETVKSIDKLEHRLHAATKQAAAKYDYLRMKTAKLYQETSDQAAQLDYDKMRTTVLDIIMDIIQEYQERMKRLIDSAIEFLKVTKFQMPGLAEKHTGEELYLMATAKLAKVTDLCISKVQEQFDALIKYVNELEIEIPASSTIIRGGDILNEVKIFLTHIQKKASQIFVGLQEIDFAEKLRELKGLVQQVFQKAEELIRNLQSQNYEYIIVQTKLVFTDALEKLKSFAEDINYLLPRYVNIIQNTLQSVISKLEEFLQYLKDLRQKYLDPSVGEWSVKYYELEDKVIGWLKSLLGAVAEWHATYIGDAADFVSRVTDRVREFVAHHGNVTELSESARDKILNWSEVAKRSAAEQNREVKAKLQEAYESFSVSSERLIAETKKLINLMIENYTAFLQYLKELLDQFEQSTADALRPYVIVRQGELRIDIPKPFDLQSLNIMPRFSEEEFRKKVELAHKLIRQGVDQSSKQWEELQRFIAQQTKENVQRPAQS
uniref:apolipoprotein B-100 n=1 Tax=Euleptes europaea TaxID=460621 RepID=UPI0025408FB3|nr:apolipoprotein B-100 [Euleptes europaea]